MCMGRTRAQPVHNRLHWSRLQSGFSTVAAGFPRIAPCSSLAPLSRRRRGGPGHCALEAASVLRGGDCCLMRLHLLRQTRPYRVSSKKYLDISICALRRMNGADAQVHFLSPIGHLPLFAITRHLSSLPNAFLFSHWTCLRLSLSRAICPLG